MPFRKFRHSLSSRSGQLQLGPVLVRLHEELRRLAKMKQGKGQPNGHGKGVTPSAPSFPAGRDVSSGEGGVVRSALLAHLAAHRLLELSKALCNFRLHIRLQDLFCPRPLRED